MTRPLRPSQAATAAALLRALADELEAPHAPGVQQALRTATETGYPTTASGTPGTPSGGSASSRPEALTITPDPAAADAARTLTQLWHVIDTAGTLYGALQAWRPDRRIRSCPRCNHPLPPGQARCQRMIDGRRCGICREDDCPRGGEPLQPGEKMRDGRCNACDIRHRRGDKSTAAPKRAHDNWRDRMGGAPKSEAVASVANLVDGMTDIEVAD